MTHCTFASGERGLGWWAGPVCLAALLASAGCMKEQVRSQAADEEHERYEVKTLGDMTTVGNANPVPVAGVGLVVGLNGTGGEPAADGYRTMLEDYLHKRGVRNVKQILASTDCALVLISGVIPAGARKGDRFDLEVQIPPRSKATSLRGGTLKECELKTYNSTHRLNPGYQGPEELLLGHTVGIGEGAILAGLGEGDEEVRLKHGRIWNGGRTKIDVSLSLVLNPEDQLTSQAVLVSNRVNDTFAPSVSNLPGHELARPQDKMTIDLRVPPQYRLNIPRYLRVVRLIPKQDAADRSLPGDKSGLTYRGRLAQDLLDPAKTVVAALRLEALGPTSKQALKNGLHSQHPLVRFCSAEALAYLGCPACGDELARAVEKQPILRAFALTALASLDESVCYDKLEELLNSPLDDEARYGAFRALRELDAKHPAVQGELLNDSFWLHEVARGGPALVHLSSSRRAEIVLFGDEPALRPPFSFLAGEFVLTATAEDDRCFVSCCPRGSTEPVRRPCSFKLRDVLRTMAELGAQYPDVVEMLQQAHRCKAVTCRVRVDALPQAITVQDLARLGRSQPAAAGDAAITASAAELGATPTLYENLHAPGLEGGLR
jgi:hypothetical protein